jgi:hypothetical protein
MVFTVLAAKFDFRCRSRLKNGVAGTLCKPGFLAAAPRSSKRMAKSKSSKLSAGTQIRVNDGVAMPEFPQVDISGWTGMVSESQGRGADIKYIIEWDDATQQRMPPEYVSHCEQQGLYAGMACLKGADVAAEAGE